MAKDVICVDVSDLTTEKLKRRAKKNIKEATVTWGVCLSESDETHIIANALGQLRSRVNSVVGDKLWSPGEKMCVPIIGKHEAKYILVHNSRFRSVDVPDDEVKGELVKRGELGNFCRDLLLTWLDTAIYYAVGSYAD